MRGAVLLEVVLALGLFVAGATIALGGLSTATDTVDRLRRELTAVNLASSLIAEVQLGVRPLQIRTGPGRGEYRLGFHPYSGLSWIRFADCAHAMIGMLEDDTWLHKAPIVQY